MPDNEKRTYQSDSLSVTKLTLVTQDKQSTGQKTRQKDFYHNQLTNDERVDVVNRIINRLKKD